MCFILKPSLSQLPSQPPAVARGAEFSKAYTVGPLKLHRLGGSELYAGRSDRDVNRVVTQTST